MKNAAPMQPAAQVAVSRWPVQFTVFSVRTNTSVNADGGRVRLREKRRGKTKKGHKRFKPAFREPRLFMIYATDEHGKLDPAFSPIIDGSLGACDHLFRLLLSYLKALNVKEASKVLFIADGAKWIWNRVPTLIKSLGLTAEQTQQRIDYWHAVS